MTVEPPKTDEDTAKARRQKLIGRIAVIALGLLVLAYAIPTFMNARP